MGFFRKITRPISRVLDKIIPNEIKPALPYLAAAAPFYGPTSSFMGEGLRRLAMGGGFNLAAQLAQEGNEGEVNPLSLGLATLTAGMTDPGAANYLEGLKTPYSNTSAEPGAIGSGFGAPRTGMQKFKDSALDYGIKGVNKIQGLQEAVDKGGMFSKEGLQLASIPATQGTMDLAYADQVRLNKQDIIDEALGGLSEGFSNADASDAIRLSMLRYGFTEDEIAETITSAGYKAGGRVGYAFGNFVKGSGVAQPVSASMRSGDRPMMSGSGMGGMLSNMINNNPQLFSSLTSQKNNSVLNMSRDFIDLNENGIDDRQEQANGGRVGFDNGGDVEVGIMSIKEAAENSPMSNESVPQMYVSDSAGVIPLADGDAVKGKTMDMMAMGAIEPYGKNDFRDEDGYERFIEIFTEFKNRSDQKNKELNSEGIKNGGIIGLNMGGSVLPSGGEMDYRGGGFIPMGSKEKADDVPARLSKNEFVMTADAVRAAGGGSVNQGAKRMYNLMNNLEARA